MKLFKLLPLSLAVAGTLASAGALAEVTEIDEMQARIAELEARIGGEFADTQQPAILNSQSEAPLGVVFSGYARYGLNYQGSDSVYVGTDGALNANATGRLGNEQNGGEIQFSRAFESDGGAIWDIVFMIDHWADFAWADPSVGQGGTNVKKLYAGASNLFESQPDLYIWAGRDFHQRPQTDLDDMFWMTHDGQGAGFYNLDLGAVKLDFSVVGAVEGDLVGDNGRYAATSKIHGMEFGPVDLAFYVNYGFKSNYEEGKDVADSAYQVAAEANFYGQKFIVRYADNAQNSVFELEEDKEALLFSLGGGFGLTDKVGLQYQAAYQTLEGDAVDDRSNANLIIRPTYQWNDVHSTWLEGGYSVVNYNDDIDATNQSWKVTLSQNIAIGGNTWSRPMIRFYATVGNSDNEYSGTTKEGAVISRDDDTLTLGAMFEAWW